MKMSFYKLALYFPTHSALVFTQNFVQEIKLIEIKLTCIY